MSRVCVRALFGVALVHLCLVRTCVQGFRAAAPVRLLAQPLRTCSRPRYTCLRVADGSDDEPSAGASAALPAAPPPSDAMANQPSSSGLLGPLRAKRVLGLVVGQSAIGLAGAGLAWGVHGSPWLALGPGFAANVGVLGTLQLGAVAALPMLAFIALGEVLELDRRFPSLAAVTAATQKTVLVALGKDFRPFAAGLGALLLALAAGAGEEVLFRGVMQEEITSRVSGPAGLAIASVVFGALHAVTPAYAVLATVAGAYFGWLYNACGHSVAVPAVAHALYDWVALLLVHYEVTKGGSGPARDEAQLKLLGLGGSEDGEAAPPKAAATEA